MPKVGNVDRDDLTELRLKYFDVDIINNSNQSIELDIEITIHFDEKRTLVSETKFNEKLNELKEPKTDYFGISIPDISGFVGPNLHINVEDRDSSLFIEREKIRGEKCAILIPQKSTEKDAFLKEIFIVSDGSFTIKGEVIVRSDDFTEGYLKKNIEYEIKE